MIMSERTQNKKILILANDCGGLYKFRKELMQACMDCGNNVVAAIPYGSFVEEIKSMGVETIETPMDRRGMNPFHDIKLLLQYIKLIKKYRPDVVFTYTIKPNVYGGMVCQLFKVPYITNITGLGTAVENGGIIQKITLTLYKMGLRKAQKVFFQNTENMEFMLKHNVVKTSYDLLPGSGVNLNNYTVSEYPTGDTIDFVFVSRIMKEKGIDQYLEAAKAIRNKYPETRFHICGFCEQAYESQLKQLNDDGVIIYHGTVKDMAAIYRQMSCTVHPTYYPEGLSNVLLESAASGRPIITTDRSGCREVVENGINGYVVKEKDSQDLIEKIERFLKLSVDERKQMGLAGRAKVEKEFDRNIVVGKYLMEISKKGTT